MVGAEVISIIALVVSTVSLSLATYFGLRDRASVRTTSNFHAERESGSAHVSVSIVNAGRRPIVLRMWAGADGSNNWVGTFLGYEQNGLRLAEHERYNMRLARHDLYASIADDDLWFSDLWFEDTLGRRYKVKHAKANLAKLNLP